MSKTVYLNIHQITEVHNKQVYVKDIGDVFCDDTTVAAKCRAIRVMTVQENKNKRYIKNVLEIMDKITQMDSTIQVDNVGEVEFIIDYQLPMPTIYLWQWIKTVFVCFICFFGAAFAIMTFNNDVSVTSVFGEIYKLVMGKESSGFTILEISYSIGLALGIIVFFNHFAKIKINTDPTPLEVEMRLYEDNINKTLIQNDGRKESGIDVS